MKNISKNTLVVGFIRVQDKEWYDFSEIINYVVKKMK